MLGRIKASALILATLAAMPSSAQAPAAGEKPGDDSMIFITSLPGDPSCNADTAQRVNIAALAKDGMHLLGHCVSVKGVFSNRMLFHGTADAVAYSRPDDVDHAGKRIGVYVANQLSMPQLPDMSHVVLIGKAGDCDELSHRKGVLMVSGYCHYSPGTYLVASFFRVIAPDIGSQ